MVTSWRPLCRGEGDDTEESDGEAAEVGGGVGNVAGLVSTPD